jgi:hypothetical protein
MSWGNRLRRLALCGGLATLAGCATKTPPLYLWETFPRLQYEALLRDGYSAQEQIETLQAQAEKARGDHAALPPGFRAHLGMLELKVGNTQRARELWQAEKSAFPESAPYMDRLLAKLDVSAPLTTHPPSVAPAASAASATRTREENPA